MVVSPDEAAPSYIDYEVCADAPLTVCPDLDPTVCDVVRVNVLPDIELELTPPEMAFCQNQPDFIADAILQPDDQDVLIIWTNGPNGNGTVLGYGNSLHIMSEGIYSAVVQDTAYANCYLDTAILVVQSNSFLFEVDIINEISCPGETDGTISAIPLSGTPPYTFTWSNGASTSVIDQLGVGNYSVTVLDAQGCQVIENILLPAPDIIQIIPGSIVQAGCPTEMSGEAAVIALGGNPPYTFQWSTGQAGPLVTGLSGGTYQVTVSDSDGCESTAAIDINQVEGFSAIAAVANPASCHNATDGSLELSVSGDTGPYSILWNTGQTTEIIDGLAAGNYSFTVSDATGECSVSDNIELHLEGSLMVDLAFIQHNACDDISTGVLEIFVGASNPYTILWSNGEQEHIISDLMSGQYSVTVTDVAGCEVTASYDILEGIPMALELEATDETCLGYSDGSLAIMASGGTTPYLYSVNGQAETIFPSFDNLPPGEYQVEVLDAMGCTVTGQIIVNEGSDIEVDVFPQHSDVKPGDQIELFSFVHSDGFVQYSWMPNFELDCPTCPNTFVSPTENGFYILEVTDQNGCIARDTAFVTMDIDFDIYIPNAFTPNDDGINDTFTIYSQDGGQIVRKLLIFDRWGELIFDNRDFPPNLSNHGWDGTFRSKPMNPAVFAYFALIEFENGLEVLYKGDITLLK